MKRDAGAVVLVRPASSYFHCRKTPKDLPPEQKSGRQPAKAENAAARFCEHGGRGCSCQPLLVSV